MRAPDQAHSHAPGPIILIWRGYASDQQDVQNVSDAHPCHPERNGSHRAIRHGPRGWREVLRLSAEVTPRDSGRQESAVVDSKSAHGI